MIRAVGRRRISSEPPAEPLGLPASGGILSPTGTILAVPHALTSGPPQAEPEERWTLGPGRKPPAGDAPPPDDEAVAAVPVAPVNARTGPR